MICKTNIVLLTDCLADLAGGAEKQIYELAKGLDKNKYNVFVVSLDSWGQASRGLIEPTGSQLRIFRVVRIYGISGLIQGIRFRHFLRQNHIDIILTYHFSSDIWGTFWGRLAGVPVIMSNRRDMGFWRKAWHVKAYRLIDHWVRKIIVVTKSIKQIVVNTEGVLPERIEVIYNGVDLPQLQNDQINGRAGLGLTADDTVIMHVANLKPVKGHQYLMEAFSGLLKQFPQTKLVLIGRDELNGRIQQMASSLNIKNNVLFLGKRDDVPQLLSLADICVLPSLSEGMSNAILEYMAAGKPVIATSVGGNPELVRDGFNGLLVEKENAQQLKEALQNLLQNKEKRQLMGQNGLLRVKSEFSMDAMIAHYEKEIASSLGIKVLHLVSSGGLFGAEQVILNLAGSADTNATHVIGALDNQHNPHLEIIEEAKKRGLNTMVFTSKGRVDLDTVKQVKKFVIDNDISIIHTHNYKANLIGAWAARQARKKWIATIHGWIGTDTKLKWYEKFDMFILRSADKTVCVSQTNHQKLLQGRFSPGQLAVISNGIDLKRFSQGPFDPQLKKDLNLPADGMIITMVGRLAPEKGHEVLFKAMAQVMKKYPDARLLVIGDGPLRNKLEGMVKDLNLSNYIIMAGLRKDMPDIYKICDIFVNASYTEGLPMTILEAMASGLPVIATNVGGVGKVIKNQENGILLEPGSPDTLALAIMELAADEGKRKGFAQKAYQDVRERFSDTRMANQYQQIYTDL